LRVVPAVSPKRANAVVYAVYVPAFRDGDGDGTGDLRGVRESLPYLSWLGVDTLWLLPFYPSPRRDGGYDVADHYGIDPRLGSFDDLDDLISAAGERGMRVLVDLVLNHTSDQHPWYQQARRDPGSRFRDWYVWSDRPVEGVAEPMFPGVEDSVWRFDEEAGLYALHRFYGFEPDLASGNDEVRRELADVVRFWCRVGVGGIRLDAVPSLVAKARRAGLGDGQVVLRELAGAASEAGDPFLLGEADVEPEQFASYVDDGRGLDFVLNFYLANYLFLALSRGEAAPLRSALDRLPRLEHGGFANFLRNHDELDLEQLSEGERAEVFERLAPEPRMRVYGRGIRRRLAPLLGDDVRRIELAFALLASLPGIPVLLYGDEIGLGDDLSRPEREAVRTPMDWQAVDAQRRDRSSLLSRVRTVLQARRSTPECLGGRWEVLDAGARSVLAVRSHGVLELHNLDGVEARVQLDVEGAEELLSDSRSDGRRLAPFGYRWLRLDGGADGVGQAASSAAR
jgi:maltose alpha-D-glucosyltransferase/alpha-amylase